MDISALVTTLLPVGEEVASMFIHNPNSQNKFSVIVGTVNALEPVFAGLFSKKPAAPAVPAAESEPVIPAGVPSAH